MEVMVKGTGVDYFTPDQVIFNINFYVKEQTYEDALNKGVQSVQNFINHLLLNNGFKETDLKTRNFVVREYNKYNESTRVYEFDGFSYSQSAKLEFDYNKEKMARMLEQLSKLVDAPRVNIQFGVKDEKDCRRNVLSKAYDDAKNQAEAIAAAAGKTLKQCVKVDFKPFTTEYVSPSVLNDGVMYERAAKMGAAQTIVNTFTPEDIAISETLYCLWIAE